MEDEQEFGDNPIAERRPRYDVTPHLNQQVGQVVIFPTDSGPDWVNQSRDYQTSHLIGLVEDLKIIEDASRGIKPRSSNAKAGLVAHLFANLTKPKQRQEAKKARVAVETIRAIVEKINNRQ